MRNGLERGLPGLVGYSGGPDSTALIAALVTVKAGPLRALHVDHGLRPEGERAAELSLVRGVCSRLGLPLSVARVRPGAIEELARLKGIGIEAAARLFRYRAFRHILEREGIERLFLAHTRDDQIETVLMRALGGAGAGGLKGIPARSGPIVRPFLGLDKADLIAYLEERGLPFSVDSTNQTNDYARNRLRHRVLPILDEVVPGWRKGLLSTSRKAGEDEAALGALAEAYGFKPRPEGGFSAELSLLAQPEAVRSRAFLAAAGKLLCAERLSSRLAASAFAAIGEGKGRYRGGGILLERDGKALVLLPALDFPDDDGYFVVIEKPDSSELTIGLGRLRLLARWTEGPSASGIRESAFCFPLIVRSRRPGDALSIRGGRKPLDELFSEWRLTAEARAKVPVLEDEAGIVAVLGSAYGGRDRHRHYEGGENDRLFSIQVKGA